MLAETTPRSPRWPPSTPTAAPSPAWRLAAPLRPPPLPFEVQWFISLMSERFLASTLDLSSLVCQWDIFSKLVLKCEWEKLCECVCVTDGRALPVPFASGFLLIFYNHLVSALLLYIYLGQGYFLFCFIVLYCGNWMRFLCASWNLFILVRVRVIFNCGLFR